MSDGPYKTLPMRPQWKALAKRAYIPAFSPEEVSEALPPALRRDWSAEVSEPFLRDVARALIGGEQGSLFPGQAEADIRSLESGCASTLEASLAASALDALADGFRGTPALEQAIEIALEARGLSVFRQIEEHFHREVSDRRAADLRRRLEQSLVGQPLRELARDLAKGAPGPKPVGLSKQGGLDDGVTL